MSTLSIKQHQSSCTESLIRALLYGLCNEKINRKMNFTLAEVIHSNIQIEINRFMYDYKAFMLK
jgi:hypothetical protein